MPGIPDRAIALTRFPVALRKDEILACECAINVSFDNAGKAMVQRARRDGAAAA
jgi:hypothetical protein